MLVGKGHWKFRKVYNPNILLPAECGRYKDVNRAR